MRYRVFEPAASLRDDVECYWCWEQDGVAGPSDPIYPDACPELIVHLGQPPSRLHTDRVLRLQPDAFVYSASRGPVQLLAPARLSLFAVRFHPWGVGSFSALPMAGRTDDEICPREIFGAPGESFVRAVRSAESDAERCRAADGFLLQAHASRVFPKRERMGELARWIRTAALTASAPDCSDRTLRRLWRERVGIEPRKYRRLLRFRQALRALEGAGSLAAIAAETGYADQAHMTREFGRLAGTTPTVLRQGLAAPAFEWFVLDRAVAVI